MCCRAIPTSGQRYDTCRSLTVAPQPFASPWTACKVWCGSDETPGEECAKHEILVLRCICLQPPSALEGLLYGPQSCSWDAGRVHLSIVSGPSHPRPERMMNVTALSPRPGALGLWDRFVGPGMSLAENALVLTAAGQSAPADSAAPATPPPPASRAHSTAKILNTRTMRPSYPRGPPPPLTDFLPAAWANRRTPRKRTGDRNPANGTPAGVIVETQRSRPFRNPFHAKD